MTVDSLKIASVFYLRRLVITVMGTNSSNLQDIRPPAGTELLMVVTNE